MTTIGILGRILEVPLWTFYHGQDNIEIYGGPANNNGKASIYALSCSTATKLTNRSGNKRGIAGSLIFRDHLEEDYKHEILRPFDVTIVNTKNKKQAKILGIELLYIEQPIKCIATKDQYTYIAKEMILPGKELKNINGGPVMIAPKNIKDKPLLVISEDRAKEFNIKGRGTVLVVNRKDYQGYVFETNDIIVYKADKYKIKTIEMSSKPTYPPILTDTIGLVVNKL